MHLSRAAGSAWQLSIDLDAACHRAAAANLSPLAWPGLNSRAGTKRSSTTTWQCRRCGRKLNPAWGTHEVNTGPDQLHTGAQLAKTMVIHMADSGASNPMRIWWHLLYLVAQHRTQLLMQECLPHTWPTLMRPMLHSPHDRAPACPVQPERHRAPACPVQPQQARKALDARPQPPSNADDTMHRPALHMCTCTA